MTTSNSTNLSKTAQDVIRMAFFHIGKYGEGRELQAQDMFIAMSILNGMIKEWQADGLHLWSKQEGFVFLTPYQGEYVLGDYQYFTKKDNSKTNTVVTALATGDSVLVVNSTTDMAVNDKIGVVLDTGYTHWTTIQSITNSTTLVLSSVMPSAASAANLVYSFTTTENKALRILSARLLQGYDSGANSTQVDIPMSIIPYESYWNMSAVTLSQEWSNLICYNPDVLTGTLYVWPRPTTGMHRLQLTYIRMLEDIDELGNTFDLPIEWFNCLHYQLAVRLATGYGKRERLQDLVPIASTLYENIIAWDNELSSITVGLDYQGYNQ